MYGDRNFLGNKFMRLPDGRIGFCTEKKTWCDVLMYGLSLDDYLYCQTYTPKISVKSKTFTKRQRNHKEGLNDEVRCDYCRDPLDTMTFVTRRGRKQVFCSKCAVIEGEGDIQDEFIIIQNHLKDVDAILYLLDDKSVVSISYFYIHIKFLVDTWKSYIGNEVLKRIFDMMKVWSTEYGDVNVLKLLEELRRLKSLLTDELLFIDNILQDDEPW